MPVARAGRGEGGGGGWGAASGLSRSSGLGIIKPPNPDSGQGTETVGRVSDESQFALVQSTGDGGKTVSRLARSGGLDKPTGPDRG